VTVAQIVEVPGPAVAVAEGEVGDAQRCEQLEGSPVAPLVARVEHMPLDQILIRLDDVRGSGRRSQGEQFDELGLAEVVTVVEGDRTDQASSIWFSVSSAATGGG
jgi:hypothetical protein